MSSPDPRWFPRDPAAVYPGILVWSFTRPGTPPVTIIASVHRRGRATDRNPSDRLDDAELRLLTEAAADGDNRALGELVRRTQPLVWRVCTALGSRGEVEDLVQETYLRALRSLPGYRGDAPVTSWLLSIARNVCADHVRRRSRRSRLLDRLRSERPGDVAWTSGLTPELDGLLAQLDSDRREAFVLTQMCGLSYEEAALVAGCRIGTIRSRVARARTTLLELVRAAEVR